MTPGYKQANMDNDLLNNSNVANRYAATVYGAGKLSSLDKRGPPLTMHGRNQAMIEDHLNTSTGEVAHDGAQSMLPRITNANEAYALNRSLEPSVNYSDRPSSKKTRKTYQNNMGSKSVD